MHRVRVPSFQRFLRLGVAGALMLPGSLKYGLGSPSEQTVLVQSSTSAAQATSSQQNTTGQNPQTTPQNLPPPPPPEANPNPPGQTPEPSPQYPAPSAQLPEPAIKNPEVKPAPKPALAPPALTIPRLSRAPALDDFLTMKPEGEIAQQMAKVTGFVQRNPHDGEKISEETKAYL